MTIVLTNDDGVRAPRIRELLQALLAAGLCVVAAPSSNQSDVSRAATYRNPVRAALSEDGTVGVPTVGYDHTAASPRARKVRAESVRKVADLELCESSPSAVSSGSECARRDSNP